MPILWNQPGVLWNSPQAVWNGESAPTPTKKGRKMSSIVLNLRGLTDLELEAKLRTLATAQTNNPTAATGLTLQADRRAVGVTAAALVGRCSKRGVTDAAGGAM